MISETIIKFDTVNDLNPIIGKVDMAGSQVTVAVPNFSTVDSIVKKFFSSVQKRECSGLNNLKYSFIKYFPGEYHRLSEVFLTIRLNGFPCPGGMDLSGGWILAVKIG